MRSHPCKFCCSASRSDCSGKFREVQKRKDMRGRRVSAGTEMRRDRRISKERKEKSSKADKVWEGERQSLHPWSRSLSALSEKPPFRAGTASASQLACTGRFVHQCKVASFPPSPARFCLRSSPNPGGTGGGTWTYGTTREELRRGRRRLSEWGEERCQGRDAGRMFKGWEGSERERHCSSPTIW